MVRPPPRAGDRCFAGAHTEIIARLDGGTVARGCSAGLDPLASLARADAGTFLSTGGDLLTTGPTGTHVMDLVLGLKLDG